MIKTAFEARTFCVHSLYWNQCFLIFMFLLLNAKMGTLTLVQNAGTVA